MTLHVWRAGDGYMAQITPPHTAAAWTSTEPLSRDELITHADRLGVHLQDVWDAADDADQGRSRPPTQTQVTDALAHSPSAAPRRGRAAAWAVMLLGGLIVLSCLAACVRFAGFMHAFGGIPWSLDFLRLNAGALAMLAAFVVGGLAVMAMAGRRLLRRHHD